MTEVQHRQALAGYWRHVTVQGGWTMRDQAPSIAFLVPMAVSIPGQTTGHWRESSGERVGRDGDRDGGVGGFRPRLEPI